MCTGMTTSALDKVLAATAELTSPEPSSADAETLHTTELVEAAGSAIEDACLLLGGVSLDSCPAEVLQAAALIYVASATMDALELAGDDWVEMTALDTTALALAGGSSSDASKPYGDVPYADPGYQEDGKKRYPLDKAHIHAAIAYFSKPKNRESYSSPQVKTIWGRIKAAAGKLGVDMSDSTGKVAASAALLELAAGPRLQERLIKNHAPFHGGHEHDHIHLGDNRHGPNVAGFAAGNNTIMAYNHPP